MKCENVPKAVKKPPVLCTTPKTTFSHCRQMEDGGNYQFAHAQHEKFCQFNFRLPSCVDTVLNLKVLFSTCTGLYTGSEWGEWVRRNQFPHPTPLKAVNDYKVNSVIKEMKDK